MIPNPVKSALRLNHLSIGTWMQLGHPGVAEVLARAGFDWICVDLEHGAIDLESMTNIFRAISGYGCMPAVRIPQNDPVWIHRCLDAGTRILIVPMIRNAVEAANVVAEAKYPPLGRRGFGYSRANNHGVDFDTYRRRANEDISIILQIEHIDAINELDAILAIDGVDALFIGPLDLTGSMGLTGQMEHPEVIAALARFRDACQRHGKPAGMHLVRPSQQTICQNIEQGYRFIALGLDNVYLGDASAHALAAARAKTAHK